MKNYFFPAFIMLIGLVTGCRKNCGPSGEPVLQLNLQSKSPLMISRIRALNARPDAPAITLPYGYTSSQVATSLQVQLPVNLNTNQSRYELSSGARRDTVTVNYQRVFTYEDVDCGYIINLMPLQPANSGPISNTSIVQSTIGEVTSVFFTRTVPYQIISLNGGMATNTGINVTLRWP
ncbi:hypothetical protein [Fibrella forsythiae]|uniref:Lipoprotein n=1 Tax=Fibrella forsythiae TaxID=2817061 RepID=A0ABS3JKX9_9BACT|nr:hypothetical protein [Fibrella forsythiae]MBO0949874.1 hypothetical protein [Fibrella forsythiae]